MLDREAARFLVRVLRSRWRDHRLELAALRRHVRRGAVVCDVGANKGSFLFWLAQWSAPGRVIAFEPQPDLAAMLARLCDRFALANVTIERAAVCAQSGTSAFFVPDGHAPCASLLPPAGPATPLSVATVTLDDYLGDAADVAAIKIDVEGAELDVLRGARDTLRRCHPLVIVECDRHTTTPDNIHATFALLSDLGYRGAFVSPHGLQPLARFDLDTHQRAEGDWFWKKKGYCNNFVFSAREG